MDIKNIVDQPPKPRVYLDITIGGKPIGRAIFELVSNISYSTGMPFFN